MAVTRRSARPASRTQQRSLGRISQSLASRPRRAAAGQARDILKSYHSDSDDDEDDDSQATTDDTTEVPPSPEEPARRRSARSSRPQGVTRAPQTNAIVKPRRAVARQTRNSRRSAYTGDVKGRVGRPPKAQSSPAKRSQPPQRQRIPVIQGNIPDWSDPRIPYDAWADVFIYAGAQGDGSNWLIHAATTCRMFLEPALAALYRCPDIKTATKARRLVSVLERDPVETRINYRTKIESLHIDIHIVPQAILYQLIYALPRLRELVIYTPMDHVPYRALDAAVRWHYPAEVFQALMGDPREPGGVCEPAFITRLKSWEWSGRLLGGHVPTVGDIPRIHQLASFSQLTRLSFTNFQVPSLHKPQPRPGDEEGALRIYEEDGAVIESIADAVSQLKSLRHLVFESSTIMNDRLLPLLPKNLESLELINCWEIKSEDLGSFLLTHGAKIRVLNLLHNQSLDLAFLTTLADTCPCLQELRVSMLYYRHHDSLNDADPMYDFALLPDQVPRWPSSLRVIDLEHIRDWSVETAEMFFQSLIDSAYTLPNLRHLAIKTMLDIPWQSRASMRSHWRNKLETVFLRTSELPDSKATPDEGDDETLMPPKKKRRTRRSLSPSRRSGRIAAHKSRSSSKLRRRQENHSLYREPDTDEDIEMLDSSDEASSHGSDQDEDTKGPELPIHGLCTTVGILFDNQKPMEIQYGMEDFRSEDEDSDEEWNSDNDDDESVIVF